MYVDGIPLLLCTWKLKSVSTIAATPKSILFSIAYEKYLGMAYPHKMIAFTRKRIHLCMLFVWLVSTIAATPHLYALSLSPAGECYAHWEDILDVELISAIVFLLFGSIAPSIAIAFAYGQSIALIKRNFRHRLRLMVSLSANTELDEETSASTHRARSVSIAMSNVLAHLRKRFIAHGYHSL